MPVSVKIAGKVPGGVPDRIPTSRAPFYVSCAACEISGQVDVVAKPVISAPIVAHRVKLPRRGDDDRLASHRQRRGVRCNEAVIVGHYHAESGFVVRPLRREGITGGVCPADTAPRSPVVVRPLPLICQRRGSRRRHAERCPRVSAA